MEGKEPSEEMRKKLLHNIGLKLASLLLAFVLWFLVVQIEDPKGTTSFSNIQVKLINTELLEKEGKVYEVLDNTDKVRVTVHAPRSIIDKIRSTDIVAEADMSKLTDINTIAIKLYAENMTVDALESNHDVVRLNVEDKKNRWIRLTGKTVGEVEEGYVVASTSLDQTNIEISGPESAVSQVSYAGVDIDVSGASTSLSANVDIQLYDQDGNALPRDVQDSIKKNVNSAYMKVEVLATKEVPVQATYTGVPAEGYMATGAIKSSITKVKIAGTSSALANVTAITIPGEQLNIGGITEDLIEVINLKELLPSNIRLADKEFDGKTIVTVDIEPIVEKEISVPVGNVSIGNLPEGVEAELAEDIEKFDVTISGLSEFVNPLQQNTMTGVIDVVAFMKEEGMKELSAGIHTIPIEFNITDDITIKKPVLARIRVSIPEEAE